MKKRKKIVIVIICAVLLLAILVGFSLFVDNLVNSVEYAFSLRSRKTVQYRDYVCVDPNLRFDKNKATDLKRYISMVQGQELPEDLNFPLFADASIHYYQIDGFKAEDIVGASTKIRGLFGGGGEELVFVNPQNNFSPFKDWTIKEIQIGGYSVIDGTQNQQLVADFIRLAEYAKEKAIKQRNERNSQESSSETDINSVTAGDNDAEPEWAVETADKSCYIKVIFNETEDVYWKAWINITRYEYGGDKITFAMEIIDPYPEVVQEIVIVSPDSTFCEFLAKVLLEE